MFASKRVRISAAVLTVALLSGGAAAAASSSALASPRPKQAAAASPAWHSPKLALNRIDLSGYVINAKYTLGRNTGSTFQQTYQASTVVGVPIAGPYVGTTFPAEDYVAIPIGGDQIYITWLDPATYAIVDVFVMNLRTHTVYDYAPGSAKPESAGTITLVACGKHPIQ
jgi:hypothetical protein